LTVVALSGILAIAAAACANNNSTSGGGGSAQQACSQDQFGCVVYKPGQPIQLGTLLSISGSTAFLGTDSQHGVQLAVDFLDGKLDGKAGTLMGHPVKMINEDDGCSAEGGQSGAQKLVGNPQLLAV